jgi:hypothetical protein
VAVAPRDIGERVGYDAIWKEKSFYFFSFLFALKRMMRD